jgi:hypothetical protein
MASTGFLTGCAWAVHLYTALGAVAGLIALIDISADHVLADHIMDRDVLFRVAGRQLGLWRWARAWRWARCRGGFLG